MVKLSDEDRWFVRCLHRQCGYSQQAIGAAWGVVQQTVSRALDAEGYRERQRTQKANWLESPGVRGRIRQLHRQLRARARGAGGEGLPHWLEPEWLRAHGRACAYCGAALTESTMTVDHIRPLILGGSHALPNLAPACSRCNSSKGATPLDTWHSALADVVRYRAARVSRQLRRLDRTMTIPPRKRTAVEELAEREARQRLDALEYRDALERFGLVAAPPRSAAPAPASAPPDAPVEGPAIAPAEPPPPAPAAPEYLTTRQAAALLGVSVKHLEALRARGGGPPYVRVGHAVRYPAAELRRPK